MNQQKIGKFIQQKRKEKNLTQEELANKLGVSNRTISKWENGRGMPDYSVILELCKVLDMSINEMLSGEEIVKENYQTMLEENIIKTIEYNNKKRNKKNLKITIFIIILLVILLSFGYKLFLLNTYTFGNNIDYPEVIKKDLKTNDKANTIVLNELSMYIPEGFELRNDITTMFVEPGCEVYAPVDATLSSGEENHGTFIKICPNKNSILDSGETLDTWLLWGNNTVAGTLLDNNIHSYYDLYEYLLNNKDKKYNLFTSLNELRMNLLFMIYLPGGNSNKAYIYKNNLEGVTTILRGSNNEGSFIADSNFEVKDARYEYEMTIYNVKNESFSEDDVFEILSSIKSNYN